LATSLSSSLPVVFIDIDGMALEPIFERELRRRCAVITAAYDERGRPIIDEAELAEAITTANKDNDPTFFRQLYAGV
jgi:hypothetical protein